MASTSTLTLTDFLLARIAEDEAAANARVDAEVALLRSDGLPDASRDDLLTMESDSWRRPLAECEAKRRIVEDFTSLDADYRVTHSEFTEARRFQALVSLAHLASVYSDHPDFRDEWRP